MCWFNIVATRCNRAATRVNSYSKDSQLFLVRSFFFLIDFLFSDTVYWIKPHSKPIIAGCQRIMLRICTLTVIQQYLVVVFHFFQTPWRFFQPLFHFVQPLGRLEKVEGRFKITLCSAENALLYITLALAHLILVDCSNNNMPARNIYPAQKQNYISL